MYTCNTIHTYVCTYTVHTFLHAQSVLSPLIFFITFHQYLIHTYIQYIHTDMYICRAYLPSCTKRPPSLYLSHSKSTSMNDFLTCCIFEHKNVRASTHMRVYVCMHAYMQADMIFRYMHVHTFISYREHVHERCPEIRYPTFTFKMTCLYIRDVYHTTTKHPDGIAGEENKFQLVYEILSVFFLGVYSNFPQMLPIIVAVIHDGMSLHAAGLVETQPQCMLYERE